MTTNTQDALRVALENARDVLRLLSNNQVGGKWMPSDAMIAREALASASAALSAELDRKPHIVGWLVPMLNEKPRLFNTEEEAKSFINSQNGMNYPQKMIMAPGEPYGSCRAQAAAEPVLYQYRQRPTWEREGTCWTPWTDCSADAYADHARLPIYNDWQTEVRKLYAVAPPAQAPAQQASEQQPAMTEKFLRDFAKRIVNVHGTINPTYLKSELRALLAQQAADSSAGTGG